MKSYELLEDRPETHLDDPDIEYEYSGKTKVATANEIYDKVIARLAKDTSGKYTRLAHRYVKITNAKKHIDMLRNTLNDEMRDAIESMFPVADDILTRVIETKSLVIKLAKAEDEYSFEELDSEAYIKELEELVKGLDKNLDDIKKKCMTTKTVAEKKAKLLTPKIKLENRAMFESIIQENLTDFLDQVKIWAGRFTNTIRKWLKEYDKQFDELDRRIENEISHKN